MTDEGRLAWTVGGRGKWRELADLAQGVGEPSGLQAAEVVSDEGRPGRAGEGSPGDWKGESGT